MGRKRKQRRQAHGSAWHWKQTDCRYYAMPGTRKRVPLFDEEGQRIRGKDNREAAADLALAKEKLSWANGDQVNLAVSATLRWSISNICMITRSTGRKRSSRRSTISRAAMASSAPRSDLGSIVSRSN